MTALGTASEAGRSRAAAFRDALRDLVGLDHVRGGALVAPDGFVIAAQLPPGVEGDAVAALVATLGRQLELGAARLGRGALAVAQFSAAGGALLLCETPVGFLVVLGDRHGTTESLRAALRRAGASIGVAWLPESVSEADSPAGKVPVPPAARANGGA
jgi:predicted regulator of Ras-like GTPase activity (Roadblock/LC7/MglB family)